MSQRRINFNLAVHHLYQIVYQRKSYSCRNRRAFASKCFKTVEQLAQLSDIDAFSLIFYPDQYIIRLHLDDKRNRFSLGSIFESIRKQIEHHLLYLIYICINLDFFLRCNKTEIYLRLMCHAYEIGVCLVAQRYDVDLLYIKLHLIVLDLTEVEQLIDELKHTFCITLGHLHVLQSFG